MQYVVLARHGQSEANLRLEKTPDGLYYSRSSSDPAVPLTAQGKRQGSEIGRRLSRMFPPQRPLKRAYYTRFARVEQTLTRIERELGYTVERVCDPRIEKRSYGDFWNLTRLGVQQLHPHEWQRYQQQGDLLYRAPGGGENYFDLFARVDDFIDSQVLPTRDNLLIVTHSVVLLSFQRRLEGLSDEEVHQQYEATTLPNAHIVVYCRKRGSSQFHRCDDEQIGVDSPGLTKETR
jgi:broad specificity phosphatase PhoE